MVGIYKITSPSNRVYIGQSWNIDKRKKDHRNYKGATILANSIKKYGFDSHFFEVVHELPNDVEQKVLDDYEQLYIDAYRNCGLVLMNLKEGGSKGKHSEELRRKMSIAKQGMGKGRVQSEEWKTKRGLAQVGNKHFLGKTHSDETKLKMRVSAIGKPKSKDHAQKCAEVGKLQAVKNQKKVFQLSKSGEILKEWDSIKMAGDSLGIMNQSITHACKGRYQLAGGFKWKYA